MRFFQSVELVPAKRRYRRSKNGPKNHFSDYATNRELTVEPKQMFQAPPILDALRVLHAEFLSVAWRTIGERRMIPFAVTKKSPWTFNVTLSISRPS
jgi:hypothetical protein